MILKHIIWIESQLKFYNQKYSPEQALRPAQANTKESFEIIIFESYMIIIYFSSPFLIAACAAESLAIGTLNGEQLT